MTKTDLIDEVSWVLEIPRKDATVIVERIIDSMVWALRDGDKVELRGFGSFTTHLRPPRIGRNPRTGASVNIPPKRILRFKPSKELKELINKAAAKQPRPPDTSEH